MEKPSFNIENKKIQRENVLTSLKNNPSDFELFNQYADQETKGHITSLDTLAWNIETARIYRDANMDIETVIQAYEDAIVQAYQEHQDELCLSLKEELLAFTHTIT